MLSSSTGRSENEAKITLLEEVVKTGQEFHKLYYETMDKRRHLIGRMYLDTAVLVWDGNAVSGTTEIQKFYENLPTTTHHIIALDAQPIPSIAVPSQKSIILQAEGNVLIQQKGGDRGLRQFFQSFTITAVEDKWKIVSDCFRLLPAADSR